MMTINWCAVDNAINYYKFHVIPHETVSYQEWMLAESGIEHTEQYIRIVDEQAYIMFLLRYS